MQEFYNSLSGIVNNFNLKILTFKFIKKVTVCTFLNYKTHDHE